MDDGRGTLQRLRAQMPPQADENTVMATGTLSKLPDVMARWSVAELKITDASGGVIFIRLHLHPLAASGLDGLPLGAPVRVVGSLGFTKAGSTTGEHLIKVRKVERR